MRALYTILLSIISVLVSAQTTQSMNSADFSAASRTVISSATLNVVYNNTSVASLNLQSSSEIIAPGNTALEPIQRSKFQKGIGVSTDVVAITLPVATLAGVLIAKDWQGLKQAAFTALAAAGSNLILKYTVRELRPDHSNYHSFPSLHSTTAFATAAFLQRRYGWKLGGPAYALAAYTAVGRVLAKKHQWWDCVAGAAIGAGSAYIFTRPWAKKHELSFMPAADDTHIGFVASMAF